MKGRITGVVTVLVLLHLLLRVGLGLDSAAPDLAVVALLIGSRPLRAPAGGALGMILGLLEDSVVGPLFGSGIFAMTVLGAVSARFRDLFVGDSVFFLATFCMVGKAVRDLLQWIVSDAALRPPMGEVFLTEILVAAVYTAAIGVAVRLTVLRPGVGS